MIEREEELHVLVVDDSAVSRKLAEFAFSGKPYVVRFAESGNQALTMMASWRPDIVVTDWMMPDMTGLELCRRLRRQERMRNPYIIVLSSNCSEAQKAEGLAAGADGYLTKPLQVPELLGQIHAARGALESRRRLVSRELSGIKTT